MIPVSVHKRTYLIITLIVSLPMLMWSYSNASRTHRMLLYQKELELSRILYDIVANITSSEEMRHPGKYSASAGTDGPLSKDVEAAIAKTAKQYPGHSIGYAASEESPTIPFGVNYDHHEPELKLVLPVASEGNAVSYVWASIKTKDLEYEFYLLLFRNLSIISVIWISVLLTIGWMFKKLEVSLADFVMQVKAGSFDIAKLREFPQLVPVVDAVIDLRQHLDEEYQQKEKVKEQLVKLDRLNLISRMAAGVAHEIRNPMTVVMGFSQMLANKTDDTWRVKSILMLEEIKHINKIVTDFLSLARNKKVDRKPTQINDIVKDLTPFILKEASMRSVKVNFSLQDGLPLVNLDCKEIIQLISNVFSNSLDAMESGDIFEISTKYNNQEVIITFSDTGCGIDGKELNQIFDPFFTTKDQATGLGLAVCKSIVDRHGGEITVNSILGQGTTVIVTFSIQSTLGLDVERRLMISKMQ